MLTSELRPPTRAPPLGLSFWCAPRAFQRCRGPSQPSGNSRQHQRKCWLEHGLVGFSLLCLNKLLAITFEMDNSTCFHFFVLKRVWSILKNLCRAQKLNTGIKDPQRLLGAHILLNSLHKWMYKSGSALALARRYPRFRKDTGCPFVGWLVGWVSNFK